MHMPSYGISEKVELLGHIKYRYRFQKDSIGHSVEIVVNVWSKNKVLVLNHKHKEVDLLYFY